MSIIPKDSLESLEHEYKLIKLLHHRNKNQHRVAKWWKEFNSLKRYLTKLITALYKFDKSPKEPIRKEVLQLSHRLQRCIIKDCYRAFNEIIALGQFINLGLVLIGILSKVNHNISQINGLQEFSKTKTATNQVTKDIQVILNSNVDDVGEEIGEIVESIDIDTKPNEGYVKKRKSSNDLFEQEKRKKKNDNQSTKTKDVGTLKIKKKKKKSRSAIDDIFG